MVKNPPAMQEIWVRSLDLEDPLKKEMATHSSILALVIPWQATVHGVIRVRNDLVTKPSQQYFFIHSSVDGHSFFVAIVNSAAMNVDVQISFQVIVFSRYICRSGTAGSSDSSIFSFLSNVHTVLCSCCIKLYIPPKSLGGFLFLHILSRTHYLYTF